MCHTLSSVLSYIQESEEAEKSNSSSHKWKPCILKKCRNPEGCQEPTRVTEALSEKLREMIQPIIDRESFRPIEEELFNEEMQLFCELNRITTNTQYSKEGKVKLISVPSHRAILSFLDDTLRFFQTIKEVAVYAYILVNRLLQATGWKLRSTNWRIILIVALRLAQKIEGYKCVSCHSLGSFYHLFQAKEFVTLENTFLKLIDYNCYVSMKEYSEYLKMFL
mmetsp:Transcript_62580/g.71797  ORF Transcript_62580/g.71797 Transcript_62580/m.71797 type:complete len:222 (+) Transcript_62580:292-957(+)|eukprot:CAMPEP_0115006704 /NCGR_PEP_ID=MMETSP0216-20121206/20674_1 /TAXON_ID=223996 /ORGANISM="Protocruzia adherens, Strain Boccale" /LENGTH=221 /DNA_ID=CAMNT_0002373369 /DNA_START=67 /DNA_END=732 /DNA_ORIENTATION=+